MMRHPNRQDSLEDVTDDSQKKALFPEQSAHISGANVAAANQADVLVSEPAHEIIARREAAEDIGKKKKTDSEVPIRGIPIVNPGHIQVCSSNSCSFENVRENNASTACEGIKISVDNERGTRVSNGLARRCRAGEKSNYY